MDPIFFKIIHLCLSTIFEIFVILIELLYKLDRKEKEWKHIHFNLWFSKKYFVFEKSTMCWRNSILYGKYEIFGFYGNENFEKSLYEFLRSQIHYSSISSKQFAECIFSRHYITTCDVPAEWESKNRIYRR